jgi:hypothetical protein
MSSRLLFKNVKIEIYEIMILPLIMYGGETSSLALGKEYRLRMLANSVLKTIEYTKL